MKMSGKKKFINVIYIGTTKLAFLRGLIEPNYDIVVERMVAGKPNGFSEGVVANVEKATASVRNLVSEVLGNEDFSKYDFYVVLSNKYIKSFLCNSSLYFGEIIRPVTTLDMEHVISQTKSVATVPLDEVIIEAVPESFLVDDTGNITDPLELEGRRLGVNLRVFTLNAAIMRNISKVLERLDIIPELYLPKSFVSVFSSLRQEERSGGVALIDIGGNVTGITYVKNTSVTYYTTIPFGSENITLGLAKDLSISPDEARRLKEEYGSVSILPSFSDEIIPIVDIFGKTKLNLSKKRLYGYIDTYAVELLAKIKPILSDILSNAGTIAGVVFTGGGSALEGFIEKGQELLGYPARIGVTRKIIGPKDVLAFPNYTGITGVLSYLCEKRMKEEERLKNKNKLTITLERVKLWIQNYF